MNAVLSVFPPHSGLVEIIVPLSLAALMGLTMGIERYIRGRPAGLRTYLLVCVSFTTIALLSQTFFRAAGELFRADPARLAAGGLTGIGFLGAGVIVRSRSDVFGLTTAASIWTMAVIGLALGAQHYMLACTLYVIALTSLWLLRYLEPILPREIFRQIALQIRQPGMTVEEARQYFKRFHLVLQHVDIRHHRQKDYTDYVFFLHGKRPDAFVAAFESLLQRAEVQYGALQQQGDDDDRHVQPVERG
jgi:putative Mg2+ transporter-C (MgtC) family protein